MRMQAKHWALALTLGLFALGSTSCKKDEPTTPPNNVTPPAPAPAPLLETLKGTWTLGDAVVSPQTVTVDGTVYQVKDHIFNFFMLGRIGAPKQVIISDQLATFTGTAEGAAFTPQIDQEGKLTYRLPIGAITSPEANKIQVNIHIANAALKGFLQATGGNAGAGAQGNPNAGKPTVDDATKVFTAIAQGSDDLTITIEGTK